MKVLIAEDSSVFRNVIVAHVRSWGYDVVSVEDGQKAWAKLQEEDAPRIAILDWQMPGMDGIDVCRNVKSDPQRPFTYVVMLSGRDAEDDIVAGLDAGADDYLTKPVEPPILRSRIAAAKRIVEAIPLKDHSRPSVPGYEVRRLLGKGAFATVWEAVREKTSQTVALKIIRVDLVTSEAFRRFAREVKLLTKFDHRNIARIYDSDVGDKIGYCAMEFIDGSTLNNFVKQQKPKASKIVEIVAQVADGLEHAHQRGVLHRDLKPTNVMLSNQGVPKLVDFGLGKSITRGDIDDVAQTMDGSVLGTPLFMAPEQARGENESLDARADIYALGTILYVLLLRRHPHNIKSRDRWETIRAIADGHPRPPSTIHPGFDPNLELLLMRSLSENRDQRFQSAAEFATELRSFLQNRRNAKKDGQH